MNTRTLDIENKNAVYRKVTRRLIPFLILCYFFAYLDRVNVGFAKLHMQDALNLSDTVYGIGAGIFFIGAARQSKRDTLTTNIGSRL